MASFASFKGFGLKGTGIPDPRIAVGQALDEAAEFAKGQFDIHGAEYTGGLAVENTAPSLYIRQIFTTDERFYFLNFGTRPHIIEGNLRFKGNYVAKTKIGAIPSSRGGASGPTVHAKVVRHPGVEARGIDEAIENVTLPVLEAAFVKFSLPR